MPISNDFFRCAMVVSDYSSLGVKIIRRQRPAGVTLGDLARRMELDANCGGGEECKWAG